MILLGFRIGDCRSTSSSIVPRLVLFLERYDEIASFAKVVNELAASGNKAANEILNAAADEVVLIATTAKRECSGGPDFQVALIGGVLAPDNLVTKMVAKKLEAHGLSIHTSGKSSLDGAGILATLEGPGIFQKLIRTFKK